MEEVADEGPLRTQITGQLLCHGVSDSAEGHCQHVEMLMCLASCKKGSGAGVLCGCIALIISSKGAKAVQTQMKMEKRIGGCDEEPERSPEKELLNCYGRSCL